MLQRIFIHIINLNVEKTINQDEMITWKLKKLDNSNLKIDIQDQLTSNKEKSILTV